MSSKPIGGNIPENITYFYGATKKLESYWENDALHAGWVGQEVTPAFCSDSTNAKTMETGRNWAKGGYWVKEKVDVKEANFKNDPIKEIKIISLEKRSEGGRAYKVVTPDNFYFDLREDVLMDTMLNAGISKNGVLNGTYIWARVGAEMKLVRTGSDLHKALLVSTADRTLKKLKYGDLEVGHIYKGKGADQYIFLGYVDYTECFFDQEKVPFYNPIKLPPVLIRNEIRNALLLWSYHDQHAKEGFDFNDYWSAHVKTSHSFIKDCGKIEVPVDVIDLVSKGSLNAMMKGIADNGKYKQTDKEREEGKLATFAYHSPRVTVRKSGEPERKFPGCHMIEQFKLNETITKRI